MEMWIKIDNNKATEIRINEKVKKLNKPIPIEEISHLLSAINYLREVGILDHDHQLRQEKPKTLDTASILSVFKEFEELPVSEIAKRLGVKIDGRKLAKIMRDLEKDGLIERRKKYGIYLYRKKSDYPALSDQELKALKELYERGQIWDNDITVEKRKILRNLEKRSLVKVTTIVDIEGNKSVRKAFWTVTEKGIALLHGEG
ncbi:hypothetical protein [Thermococcus sp.]